MTEIPQVESKLSPTKAFGSHIFEVVGKAN